MKAWCAGLLCACWLSPGCGDGDGSSDATDAVDTGMTTTTTGATDTSVTQPPDADVGDPPGGGACGGESVDGRCEGTEVVYCESIESGVARFECAPDYECAVVDGYADCRLPGSAGCGRVNYQGYCDGDASVYCDWEVTEVVRYDCGADGMTCGFVDDEIGYYCLPRPDGGALSVKGSFWFEKPAVTQSGLGAVSEAPVRRAVVQIRKAADDALVATGATDDEGAFEVSFDDPGGDVYALAMALVDDARNTIAVRDCPLDDCEDVGFVHAIFSETFTPSTGGDIGGWVGTREGSAGAFNIFDVFLRGQDFAWQVYGVKPPALTGQWAAGSETVCATLSCFFSRGNIIYVVGRAVDGDEFDDPVLAHELGHYLESAFSRTDSPGGEHDGSPTDPLLAWGEGYGTFAGCEMLGSPVYIDTSTGGASVVDISDTGLRASPGGGLGQLVSEYVVAEGLWTLARGGSGAAALGSVVIFDVLGVYFPTSRLVDRGVSGVDFVDFLDGLMCRGNATADGVRRVVVDRLDFPYDFGGPASCR